MMQHGRHFSWHNRRLNLDRQDTFRNHQVLMVQDHPRSHCRGICSEWLGKIGDFSNDFTKYFPDPATPILSPMCRRVQWPALCHPVVVTPSKLLTFPSPRQSNVTHHCWTCFIGRTSPDNIRISGFNSRLV